MANATLNPKIQSATRPYAGQLGHRENFQTTSNNTVILMDSALTLKPNDGVTHVVADATAGAIQLVVPSPVQCKGRAIKVRKSQATNALTVVAADGANVGPTATLSQTTVASLELFSTGSAWIQVF